MDKMSITSKSQFRALKIKYILLYFFRSIKCYETHLKLIKEEIEKQEKVES